MNVKKNKYLLFFRIIFLLFVVYLCLYSVNSSGYVDQISKNKTLYTEEQMNKFENDVYLNKEIDLEEYKLYPDIDYSNAYSDFGEKISNVINYGAEKSISIFNNIFATLFK